MAEAAGGTGAEVVVAVAGMTTGAAGSEAWDLVAAAAGVRRIGGKPKCC